MSSCLPRDYFKSGSWRTGCPGCWDCLNTPNYMHEFPPGFVCLQKDSCILWLQGTSNWKGWDHAGSKNFGGGGGGEQNKIELNWLLDVWKATARYCCAQHLQHHSLLWGLPTFTASRLGCPTCYKPQHLATDPKHSLHNSLSQHLNPALHNALNLTSTTPCPHLPREPGGELDWKTHQPWKGC